MSTQADELLICMRDNMHIDYLLTNAAYFAAKGIAGPHGGDVGEQGLIALLHHISDRLVDLRKDADELARLLQKDAPKVLAP